MGIPTLGESMHSQNKDGGKLVSSCLGCLSFPGGLSLGGGGGGLNLGQSAGGLGQSGTGYGLGGGLGLGQQQQQQGPGRCGLYSDSG